ncbi:hypothetical protein QTP86_034524 [Hemibagrus guttatus]|nr:hypothetical protein QTP86_034524 [Hemibagrus guttatus]
MRLQPETALVVCLCLWIPVAQSYSNFAPNDQDGSGDDEDFSGSGSGDNDMWLTDTEVKSQVNPNITRIPWITATPVNLPEVSVTPPANLATEPETSGHLTEARLPYTTQTTETQPSLFVNKSFGSVKDQKGEPTTVSTVAQPATTVPLAVKLPVVHTTVSIVVQPETTVPPAVKLPVVPTTVSIVAQPETTVPPAVKLPVVPTKEDKYTPAAKDKEDATESSVIDQEKDEATVVKAVSVTTEAPDMETTPLLHSTESAGNLADTEASGDSVVSSTVPGIVDPFIETNIIPEDRDHNVGKPRMNDNDFDFGDNEIQKPELNPDSSGSDFARGSASDNDSLLERKEVLAGVIAGGVVGLAFAIMLVALMVYRMKKKDEGSYSLDENKHPSGGYQKPLKQEEFLA